VLLALDESAAALDRLRSACDARDPWAVLLPVDPMLRPLHDEPRFRNLAARVRGATAAPARFRRADSDGGSKS
jgi:hypothetical protein